ncbi:MULTISPECIES: hypothetical protein [Heyndrickxia]|uniref:hypothetical protein n=1 Tax=Heyndrickxia TaxID=2837504 RepID=UPI002DB8E192|nr:hypothetical protein [Weizmannia sp. CD-2023]MEC2306640.1 hypothetical protein [Weizmannia sp. CD-2023]MEC2342311.1 hypothetical protein [Weizmannia sp. CD-2023]
MEIKIGQVYKEKQHETLAMVVAVQNESIMLGTGNLVSPKTIEDRYILVRDAE